MLMVETFCLRVASLFLLAERQQREACQLVCFCHLEVEPPFVVIRVGDRRCQRGGDDFCWVSSVAPLARPFLERKVIRNAVPTNGNIFRQKHIHFFHGSFFFC